MSPRHSEPRAYAKKKKERKKERKKGNEFKPQMVN
jgi:hypothetical protein